MSEQKDFFYQALDGYGNIYWRLATDAGIRAAGWVPEAELQAAKRRAERAEQNLELSKVEVKELRAELEALKPAQKAKPEWLNLGIYVRKRHSRGEPARVTDYDTLHQWVEVTGGARIDWDDCEPIPQVAQAIAEGSRCKRRRHHPLGGRCGKPAGHAGLHWEGDPRHEPPYDAVGHFDDERELRAREKPSDLLRAEPTEPKRDELEECIELGRSELDDGHTTRAVGFALYAIELLAARRDVAAAARRAAEYGVVDPAEPKSDELEELLCEVDCCGLSGSHPIHLVTRAIRLLASRQDVAAAAARRAAERAGKAEGGAYAEGTLTALAEEMENG